MVGNVEFFCSGFEAESLVGATLKPGEKFAIKIMFCPEQPGKFYCKGKKKTILIILNG